MTSHYLTLRPHGSIVARDGRPFGAGQGHRMKSLDWLYPSVLSGAVRTLLGKLQGGDFDPATVKALKLVEVAGPLPMVGEQLYFPAPKDCVLQPQPRTCFGVRPGQSNTGEGCDFPHAALRPVLLPSSCTEEFKPIPPPAFWSQEQMTAWLNHAPGTGFLAPPEKSETKLDFLAAPEKDERIHVAIDPNTYANEEGLLYMTVGLAFDQNTVMAARLACDDGFAVLLSTLNEIGSLGGERCLVHFQTCTTKVWRCPEGIQKVLAGTERVRMVLATPALFKKGWLPDWLDERLEGSPPDAKGVKLRLVAASLDRWQPISGWSLEPPTGPKPTRRLVPAGGVYFFEVAKGSASALTPLWLQSVCRDQDRRDGFGLALWGDWQEGK